MRLVSAVTKTIRQSLDYVLSGGKDSNVSEWMATVKIHVTWSSDIQRSWWPNPAMCPFNGRTNSLPCKACHPYNDIKQSIYGGLVC